MSPQGQPVGGVGPCVALLEMSSLAAGFEVVDALSKEATVELVLSRAVSPGKYVVLFTGAVEDVRSALLRGVATAGETLLDRLFIPNLEPTLFELARGASPRAGALEALGILETDSVASTLRAADVASKTASLRLVSLSLASGLGGKSFVTFTGEVGDVTAAAEAGGAEAGARLVRRVVIPRPHAVMEGVLEASRPLGTDR